jgi:hypothetical protein
MPQLLKYRTGEEIRKGDRVLIRSLPGEIELVAIDPDDPERSWYVQECGEGVMIPEPQQYGRVFTGADDDDLEFVSRGEGDLAPETIHRG